MKGRKSKKIWNIAIAIVVVVFLLGCGTGIVCGRGINKDGELEIAYKSDVDTGSEADKNITEVKVKEAEFFTCQMNDTWPDCKKEAKDFPDLPDLPTNKKYRSYKLIDNQKARIVCVDSVSHPRALITNKWRIGTHEGQEDPEEQGMFQTCFTASAGQSAEIVAFHSDPRRSTIICTVWMLGRDGKKQFLDWAFAQRLAPCKASARIP